MGVLLDSNILIKFEKGKLELEQTVAGREQEPFYISVITASELLHGVWRASDPAIQTRRSAFVETILRDFPILPIDVGVARVHSRIWSDLHAQGIMVGPHDAWIGATAIAHGLSLVTANVREFQRIPGLKVEVW